jgi:hypothetical protein
VDVGLHPLTDSLPDVTDATEDPAQLAKPAASGGLSPLERCIASLIGLAGVGAGGAGVFLSDNQAGTTAILLLGAVFLLMGVQGTAIIKAGKDSVELERRQAGQKILKRAVEIAENDPGEASELIEAAKAVDPPLRSDPAVRELSYRIYETEIGKAIRRAAERLTDRRRSPIAIDFNAMVKRREVDALIYDSARPEHAAAIELKATSRSYLSPAQIDAYVGKAKSMNMPVLLVSNANLPQQYWINTLDNNRDLGNISVVVWRNEQDDIELTNSLDHVLNMAARQ